jgi:hypothetical protein
MDWIVAATSACQIVIRDIVERSGAAPNASRLWQYHLITRLYQPFAEVIEVVNAASPRRNEDNWLTFTADRDLKRCWTCAHDFPSCRPRLCHRRLRRTADRND